MSFACEFVEVLSEFAQSVKSRMAECEAASATPKSRADQKQAKQDRASLVRLTQRVVALRRWPPGVQELTQLDLGIRIIEEGSWASFVYERPKQARVTRVFRKEKLDQAGLEFMLVEIRAEQAKWNS